MTPTAGNPKRSPGICMSPNSDERRMKSSRLPSELVDFATSASLARRLQATSVRMRLPVTFSVAVGGAVLGAALLLNGMLSGALLLAGLPLLPLLRRRSAHQGPVDRSAVRLALRLAQLGQRTLLVETGARMRVVTLQEAARGPQLQYIGARSNGALILARTPGR